MLRGLDDLRGHGPALLDEIIEPRPDLLSASDVGRPVFRSQLADLGQQGLPLGEQLLERLVLRPEGGPRRRRLTGFRGRRLGLGGRLLGPDGRYAQQQR